MEKSKMKNKNEDKQKIGRPSGRQWGLGERKLEVLFLVEMTCGEPFLACCVIPCTWEIHEGIQPFLRKEGNVF